MLGKYCATELQPQIPWSFGARSYSVAQAGLEPVMLLPQQVPPNAEISSLCHPHPTQLEPACLKPPLCLSPIETQKEKQAFVSSIYKSGHSWNLS